MDFGGQEKRKSPRVKVSCKLIIYDSVNFFNTETKDLSISGARFEVNKEISKSTKLRLELFLPEGKIIKCYGEVIWVSRRTDIDNSKRFFFDTGVRFVDISDDDKKYIALLIDSVEHNTYG